jgi:hypothetical protein
MLNNYFGGKGGRYVWLTTLPSLCASTSWNPQGLSRPVMGLLYPFTDVSYALTHTSTSQYTFMSWRLIKRRDYFTFNLPLTVKSLKSPLYISCPEPQIHFLPSLACSITRQSLPFFTVSITLRRDRWCLSGVISPFVTPDARCWKLVCTFFNMFRPSFTLSPVQIT